MSDNIDVSDLLDSSIDDLADLPEFATFPAGAHSAKISFSWKKVNEQRALEVKLTAIETQELANPQEDTPLTAGTETTVLYIWGNEFAQGKIKPILVALGKHHGLSNVVQIIEASQGMEVVVVTKVRQNKDKTQSYTDLVNVVL